jgi:hypothetical protein
MLAPRITETCEYLWLETVLGWRVPSMCDVFQGDSVRWRDLETFLYEMGFSGSHEDDGSLLNAFHRYLLYLRLLLLVTVLNPV